MERRSKGAGAVFVVRRKRRQADFATTKRKTRSGVSAELPAPLRRLPRPPNWRPPVKWGPGKGDYEHEVLIGAGPYPLCPFGTSPLDKGSRPRRRFAQSLVGSRRSPAKRGSPGRGGARKRTQFSPLGGNGVEWTLRRRAAMGKVTRRPQTAEPPAITPAAPTEPAKLQAESHV